MFTTMLEGVKLQRCILSFLNCCTWRQRYKGSRPLTTVTVTGEELDTVGVDQWGKSKYCHVVVILFPWFVFAILKPASPPDWCDCWVKGFGQDNWGRLVLVAAWLQWDSEQSSGVWCVIRLGLRVNMREDCSIEPGETDFPCFAVRSHSRVYRLLTRVKFSNNLSVTFCCLLA